VKQVDYVIVGAGPAGCVLANRLSADPDVNVLLVEAGGEDTNPLIAMPMGFSQLLGDPATAWHYPIRAFGPSRQVEHWVRGKTLGGSSSVNGMVYNRGNRADYDALERLGNPGWGWDDMLPAFKAIENNELGASDLRGAGGPLQVSTVEEPNPLTEDVITAGTKLGWRRMRDTSAPVDSDPFDRMLLIADGTVSSLLEACTGEPITTTTTRQAGPATLDVLLAATGLWWQPDTGLVELAPTEQLIVRRVTLRGGRSGTPYVLAESLVVPDRLPGVNVERLSLAGASLGRLLAVSGLETRREVLRITAQRAGAASDHLGTEPSTTLACRTYSIVVRQRAAAVVTEWLVPGRLATAALRGHQGAGPEPRWGEAGTDLPGRGWWGTP
jgi:choline dehydrogenase-like flavoprotein